MTHAVYGLKVPSAPSGDDVIDHVTDGDVRTLSGDEVWVGGELRQPLLLQATCDVLLCLVQGFYRRRQH